MGDCLTYFETFASYFQFRSHMMPFAASHFEGHAKSWWVHKRSEYWSTDDDDDEAPRFRYPGWEEFVHLLNEQFRDPAVKEMHEKKMYELRMSKEPATHFFYKLEKEASLAGWRGDEGK
ncbi:uncharacterized protein ARMOST_07543 [Armillaria ostoyae]|uniref:Retrotransposon gag domain-containing protein n=1 Tax=Armillaria ostoyae TaxID=47428 RepID=A0A284R641_ARMOS|nr:uncharacterized protein ARMOST_07543 [Armillaria ostoyae]